VTTIPAKLTTATRSHADGVSGEHALSSAHSLLGSSSSSLENSGATLREGGYAR
jgi:hypothetical protein